MLDAAKGDRLKKALLDTSDLERQKDGNDVETALCHAPLAILLLLHLKPAIPILVHGWQGWTRSSQL